MPRVFRGFRNPVEKRLFLSARPLPLVIHILGTFTRHCRTLRPFAPVLFSNSVAILYLHHIPPRSRLYSYQICRSGSVLLPAALTVFHSSLFFDSFSLSSTTVSRRPHSSFTSVLDYSPYYRAFPRPLLKNHLGVLF